jgi:cystathionine beta-synthase
MTSPEEQDPLDRVGHNPLVRVTRLDTGPCELFLKLESHNPGGSKRAGLVGPSQRRIVEATAGNTGLGLALACAQRGYELTLVIPDKMSREKVLHAKALGAQVVMTRSDDSKGHPAYYVDLAKSIAKKTSAYHVPTPSVRPWPVTYKRESSEQLAVTSLRA